MMDDDYKNYPKSVNEHKAYQEENASIWTPRDALIAMLRDIDDGTKSPDVLVICYSEKIKENTTKTGFIAASPNPRETFGTLELAKLKIWESG